MAKIDRNRRDRYADKKAPVKADASFGAKSQNYKNKNKKQNRPQNWDRAEDENGRKNRPQNEQDAAPKKPKSRCPVAKRCGGCTMINTPYDEQLRRKQEKIETLLGEFGRVDQIIRMKKPDHYRNKVTSVFAPDRRTGKPVCGIYKFGTHEVVPVKRCMLEDLGADRIIQTIYGMLDAHKIKVYDEDKGTGLLRYVQVRFAHSTKQMMVTLVMASAVFPQAKYFVAELLEKHPEITTIVMNINDKDTTMVLGDREKILHGTGYIEDVLCGKRFRLSSRSFYQVNSLQTEKLYNIAVDYAGFSGKERILDAYCGIGTIGIIAADKCKEVMSVELNAEAVKDAGYNVTANNVSNVTVYQNDAGKFMHQLAAEGEKVDVLMMDPPRSGASEAFLEATCTLRPNKIVYISCDPDTLARDVKWLTENGYAMKKAVPVDMFPYTPGVETVCLLSNTQRPKKESYITLDVEMEDYYRIKNEEKNSNTGK